MRTFKTEGIVLKRRNFGEADRILTVFTLSRGKISILAKGVRRITSRRAGNIELLNRVSMYLFLGKGMPILTEAESLETFQKIKEDLTLITYAYHIIELVDRMTAENQENRILYIELVEALRRLSQTPRQIWVRAFEMKILSNLGFLSFQNPTLHLQFHPFNGSERLMGILRQLEISKWDEIGGIEVEEKEALELERLLRYHLERVTEVALKSRQFLKRI